MKKFLLGLMVALVGIVGTLYYITTSNMMSVGDNFFKEINKNDIVKAEVYLAKGFKENTSRNQLLQYMINYNLKDYSSLDWSFYRKDIFENINNVFKEGSLVGHIKTKSGESSELKIVFKKEEGDWKIFFLEKVLSEEEKKKEKILADYTQLSRISIHLLAQSTAENNMTKFYNGISKVWHDETTVEKLTKIYGIFIEKKVNLLGLSKMIPKLNNVSINKSKVLTLSGFYTLPKNKIIFIEKYVIENKVWKLAGLSIQIK